MTLPTIKIKDRNFSVVAFENVSKEGKKYTSFMIQRAYKVNDDWKYETINLFADDLLRISAMCDEAYKQSLNKKVSKVEEPSGDIDDTIPF